MVKNLKKSIATSLSQMGDLYTRFKVLCAVNGKTIRQGLREAITDYLKKYEIKDNI